MEILQIRKKCGSLAYLIFFQVKMKEHCRDEKYDEDSDGLCHTVNVKKCQTEYKPSTTKVKVRVCPDGAVDLDDESKHKMQDNRYALLPNCVFKQIFFQYA